MKKLTEQEKYYCRKNEVRDWFCEHWHKFIIYPLAVTMVVLIGWALAGAIVYAGLRFPVNKTPTVFKHEAGTNTIYYFVK